MKLVFTILGTYNSGGMERVLANKVNYLARLGHNITIVTTDQQNRVPFFEMDSSINHIDLAINYTIDIGKNLFKRGVSYFKNHTLHKKRLNDVLFELRPDITISMFDNDASFITNIKDGSKKILEIHFSRFKLLQYARGGVWKIIDSLRSRSNLNTVQKFDRFVVLTEEDKTYWRELPNIVVIPNANSFESDIQSTLDSKQVLAIGRLDYQKGFDELIKIWAKIAEYFPDWKLNIYGHGPLKNDFQSLIDSLNVQDSVQINQPTKDIKEVFLNHSIVVMTSRYEGLPMVLLESQVMGLPMISYACKCGPRDIIQDGENGFLINEKDQVQFASKLTYLMEQNSLRKQMGLEAFENSKNFSEDIIMRRWLDLFNDVLSK